MMMSQHHSRRMLPPGNNRKRKLQEADKPAAPKAAEPASSNRLLAGYLAHEFLTKGTLFGHKYEPNTGRSECEVTLEPKRSQAKAQAAESGREPSREGVSREQESYGEVASIMKTEGTHIKGIVNPTQLSRWIHNEDGWALRLP